MADYNSKASQILNGLGNFLNGVSNTARDSLNSTVDLAATALKYGDPTRVIANAVSGGKINKAIDKTADILTGRDPKALQKQPEDPTSLAYAAGAGLTEGVEAAGAVLSLAELAKNLPKAAQKGWNAILNKVKDAKTQTQKRNLAKEAREYIDNNTNLFKGIGSDDVPAYQQRAVAREYNINNPGETMETYADQYYNNGEMKTFNNLTDKMAETNNIMKNFPKETQKIGREADVLNQINKQEGVTKYLDKNVKRNFQNIAPLTEEEAYYVGVPYKGSNMNEVREMQNRINDIAKMSNKDFRQYMSSVERAEMAGYGPDWYNYRIEDQWHRAGANDKELGKLRDQIINSIAHSYGPDQYGTVSSTWQDIAKSNAIKNSKVYRKWKVKDIKDQYDVATKGATRGEIRDNALHYGDLMNEENGTYNPLISF